MRRLCAIVPPFGVEEDVRWVEEDVPEEDEAGIPRGKSDTKIADVDDDVGGGAAAAAASTSSTSSTTSSTSSTLDPEVLVPGVRRCLPPAPPPGSKPSILAILKRITSTPGGAQLMNIQLPLQLCEPMSEIQRRAEILVPGVRCLDAAAAAAPLSLERLLHVAAYAASTYACTVRTTKCVSPVLSETVDALVPELGVRMLSELVAGDKGRARGGYMASAWVVQKGGRLGWSVCGDDAPLASLRASGLEIQAAFRSRLEFADGDVYDWARATPTAVGLASGRNAVTYDGRVRIAPVLPDDGTSSSSGGSSTLAAAAPAPAAAPSHVLHAVLDFRAPSLMAALKGGSAVSRDFKGWVERVPASQTQETTPATRERVSGVEFEGDFATHLDVVVAAGAGAEAAEAVVGLLLPPASSDGGSQRQSQSQSRHRLWTTPQVIPGCRYGYTKFSAGLNDDGGAAGGDGNGYGSGGAGGLAPTDSRRRLDTRLLEAGRYDEAQAQLDRILEIERKREAAMGLGEDGKLRAVWFEEVGGGIYRAAAAAAAAGGAAAGAAAAAAESKAAKSATSSSSSSSSRLATPAELSAFLVAEAATNSHREFKRAPLRWKFTGDYWRAREEKDWSRSPLIF